MELNCDKLKAVLLDLDGTVYYGSKIIPGANETIEFFRNRGLKVFFATNNSTKTRQQIFERLTGMGVDCWLEEILTSGYLAALYCRNEGLKDVHVLGSPSLVSELKAMGVPVDESDGAKNLLIGYDPHMTYEALTSAARVALHADIIMVCNKERMFPGEGAKLFPGCGAMTAPIEWCANRECDVIIGKPSTFMIDMVCSENDLEPIEVLMIGDSYASDITMAQAAGCQSIWITDEMKADQPSVASIADAPVLMTSLSGSI